MRELRNEEGFAGTPARGWQPSLSPSPHRSASRQVAPRGCGTRRAAAREGEPLEPARARSARVGRSHRAGRNGVTTASYSFFPPSLLSAAVSKRCHRKQWGLKSKQGLTAPLLEYCFITHNQHCDLTAVLLCGFCGCKLTAPAAALPLASVLVSQQQAAHTDKPTHTLYQDAFFTELENKPCSLPSPRKASGFWNLQSSTQTVTTAFHQPLDHSKYGLAPLLLFHS